MAGHPQVDRPTTKSNENPAARRPEDRPETFPEFAEELRGGEPRCGDHGGGQRRGAGYGGQAKYNDLSYGNAGHYVEPFAGTFGDHGGLYDGPAPPPVSAKEESTPQVNPPYRAH